MYNCVLALVVFKHVVEKKSHMEVGKRELIIEVVRSVIFQLILYLPRMMPLLVLPGKVLITKAKIKVFISIFL